MKGESVSIVHMSYRPRQTADPAMGRANNGFGIMAMNQDAMSGQRDV
jgi:hypothetical protein